LVLAWQLARAAAGVKVASQPSQISFVNFFQVPESSEIV
jgi:hypothetical protein